MTKSAPGHISEEGDKTCWMIDYIQKGNVSIDPMVSKTVRRAFMKLHDTAMDELCKHNISFQSGAKHLRHNVAQAS